MEAKITRQNIEGLFEIKAKNFIDKRGQFISCFKENENVYKQAWGLNSIKQVNISVNKKVGTIRGLHLQKKPFEEVKIVKCIKGKVWDVIVDLRKDSISFGKWLAFELSQDSNNSLIIPKGCAHGFQVLEKDSHLLYIHSENWESSSETGVVWNDEKLSIKWPLSAKNISTRDTSLPKLEFYEI